MGISTFVTIHISTLDPVGYDHDSTLVVRRLNSSFPLAPHHREAANRIAELQPYVDRVNASIASPAIERKSITFEAFAEIWKRDYLSLSKPSTQAVSEAL